MNAVNIVCRGKKKAPSFLIVESFFHTPGGKNSRGNPFENPSPSTPCNIRQRDRQTSGQPARRPALYRSGVGTAWF
jgi:hypothetical protein